jgi:hypothetical protein
MVMCPPPKILFGFELGGTHAWSQVSLAGPRTCSTALPILDAVCSFSSLIIYLGVLLYNFLFLVVQFYFMGNAY